MSDIQEVRRRNLRRLVQDHEGMNNLARQLGLTKGAYISQLLSDKPLRTISEKVARKWERTLGLAYGWLDGDPGTQARTNLKTLDAALLEGVILEVSQAAADIGVPLPPGRMAELVSMQYMDAVAMGRIDADRVRKIVGLLKR